MVSEETYKAWPRAAGNCGVTVRVSIVQNSILHIVIQLVVAVTSILAIAILIYI